MPPSRAKSFLSSIADPHSAITPIDSGLRFPEIVPVMRQKYEAAIRQFADLVGQSVDSGQLLAAIRAPGILADRRTALLKIFRRCVSGVCDTEATRKVQTIPTQHFLDHYGSGFKPIQTLREQFVPPSEELISILAVSIGEYDNRGQQGYVLAKQFFEWFEARFEGELTIEGPRGSGPDVEFRDYFPDFPDPCPCDFAIRRDLDGAVVAVGFARYDSTRGGAQSDDRTGSNADKVRESAAIARKPNSRCGFFSWRTGPVWRTRTLGARPSPWMTPGTETSA